MQRATEEELAIKKSSGARDHFHPSVVGALSNRRRSQSLASSSVQEIGQTETRRNNEVHLVFGEVQWVTGLEISLCRDRAGYHRNEPLCSRSPSMREGSTNQARESGFLDGKGLLFIGCETNAVAVHPSVWTEVERPVTSTLTVVL